jgi:hypothetical protein
MSSSVRPIHRSVDPVHKERLLNMSIYFNGSNSGAHLKGVLFYSFHLFKFLLIFFSYRKTLDMCYIQHLDPSIFQVASWFLFTLKSTLLPGETEPFLWRYIFVIFIDAKTVHFRERARRVVKKLHFSKRISRRLGMSKGAPTPNLALARANGANDACNKIAKHNGRAVEQDLVTTISAAVQEPTTVVQQTRNRVRIQVEPPYNVNSNSKNNSDMNFNIIGAERNNPSGVRDHVKTSQPYQSDRIQN